MWSFRYHRTTYILSCWSTLPVRQGSIASSPATASTRLNSSATKWKIWINIVAFTSKIYPYFFNTNPFSNDDVHLLKHWLLCLNANIKTVVTGIDDLALSRFWQRTVSMIGKVNGYTDKLYWIVAVVRKCNNCVAVRIIHTIPLLVLNFAWTRISIKITAYTFINSITSWRLWLQKCTISIIRSLIILCIINMFRKRMRMSTAWVHLEKRMYDYLQTEKNVIILYDNL